MAYMEAIAGFRQKIKDGYICLGSGITFTDPLVVEALCDAVDFFWIDLEHSPMSPETLSAHLLAARSRKAPAIVRVSAGMTHLIKWALDAGAEGIIVPVVRSVEEVKSVVNDCRYPPLGQRGFGPRVPSNFFRDTSDAFVETSNKNIFVSVMIETAEAFAALDEILAIPGLDLVVIGPADLSMALIGKKDLEHPQIVKAIETIVSKAKIAGKSVGAGMGPDVELALRMAKRGINWLQVGEDCSYLYKAMGLITTTFRERMK